MSSLIKILVVDDDHAILGLYRLILNEFGLEKIETATNGKAAVEKVKNCSDKPDVIIMDHRMPIMNGIDAMKHILNIEKNIEIIFISADVSVKEVALSIGAKIFLKKPFDINKLQTILMNNVV